MWKWMLLWRRKSITFPITNLSVPTINVAAFKNATALIVGAIWYRNVTGIISSCISILKIKKFKKIVKGKIYLP